jgi:lysophospholipase L1-like esterase
VLKKKLIDIIKNKKLKAIAGLILFYVLSVSPLKAQKADYFIGSARYSFIDYENNIFLQTENNPEFISFYGKIDSLVRFGDRKVNILHFGGSHIQADIYTNQMRKRLIELSPDMNAGRGMIFPVKMAQTNNPSNFSVSYTGKWVFSKCTKSGNDSLLGLTGFSVTTSDSICSITVDPNRDSLIHYTFSRARVFHESTQYKLQIKTSDSIYFGNYNEKYGFTEFHLNNDQDIFTLLIHKDSCNDSFSLFGISIENDAPGIIYNSVGVNGAMLSSYLRCNLLPKHLSALSPDLVVFSIGTNEGNTLSFDSLAYINNYRKLLNLVKTTLPNVAILLTVPNDCYYHKKYTNKNTSVIRNIIYTLAEEKNCGIWDFYEVMGGFNSAQTWYSSKLMNFDRIHFNREGYLLKGDLFFSAFLRSWEWHIENYASFSFMEKSIDLHAQATIQ